MLKTPSHAVSPFEYPQHMLWLRKKKIVLLIRPSKKNMCASGNGSEILGRVGTHIFFNYFFLLEIFFYAF